jgi:hypothetical protein
MLKIQIITYINIINYSTWISVWYKSFEIITLLTKSCWKKCHWTQKFRIFQNAQSLWWTCLHTSKTKTAVESIHDSLYLLCHIFQHFNGSLSSFPAFQWSIHHTRIHTTCHWLEFSDKAATSHLQWPSSDWQVILTEIPHVCNSTYRVRPFVSTYLRVNDW